MLVREVNQALTSKDCTTQKLVRRALCTKCYMNIKEGDDFQCPEDQMAWTGVGSGRREELSKVSQRTGRVI